MPHSSTSNAPPIGEAEGKRAAVEAMFDRVAPRYDLLNRVLSLGIDQWWRRQAVAWLQNGAPDGAAPKRLLDVATGTADLALEAAKRLPGAPEVVGIDLSEPMLARGRTKAARQRLAGRVRLLRADAAALPFEDGAFDAALVAFGVRNFENLRAGLTDVRRVLKPGGALVVLEFSTPRLPVFREIYQFYSRYVLPNIGRLLSDDAAAYEYLPASVEAFPDGPAFMARMQEAGFEDVAWRPLTLGIASLYKGRAA